MRNEIWMSRKVMAAVFQAAHERFSELGEHGIAVLAAIDNAQSGHQANTYSSCLRMRLPERDALTVACAAVVGELAAKPVQKPQERDYRACLAVAISNLCSAELAGYGSWLEAQ